MCCLPTFHYWKHQKHDSVCSEKIKPWKAAHSEHVKTLAYSFITCRLENHLYHVKEVLNYTILLIVYINLSRVDYRNRQICFFDFFLRVVNVGTALMSYKLYIKPETNHDELRLFKLYINCYVMTKQQFIVLEEVMFCKHLKIYQPSPGTCK